MKCLSYWLALSGTTNAQAIFKPQYVDRGSSSYTPSVTIDLSSLYDNRGFAMRPNDSNYDGLGSKVLFNEEDLRTC